MFAFKAFIALNPNHNGTNFPCVLGPFFILSTMGRHVLLDFFFSLYNFHIFNTIKWLVQALWVGHSAKIEYMCIIFYAYRNYLLFLDTTPFHLWIREAWKENVIRKKINMFFSYTFKYIINGYKFFEVIFMCYFIFKKTMIVFGLVYLCYVYMHFQW